MTLKPALPQWRMGWENWSAQVNSTPEEAFKAGVAFADMLHEVRFQSRSVDLLNDAEIANLNRVTLKCECSTQSDGVHGH